MRHALLVLTIAGAALGALAAAAPASETEFAPWTQVRIEARAGEAGPIAVVASVDGLQWKALRIDAFGKGFELNAAQLATLEGFPLHSIRLTHAALMREDHGHFVGVDLRYDTWEGDQLVQHTVHVAVSQGEGLYTPTPERRVLRDREP